MRKTVSSTELSKEAYTLHKAIQNRKNDLYDIKALLSQESLNKPDDNGRTPLHYAFLRTQDSTHLTSMNLKIIRLLLEKGADLFVKDTYGKLPWEYCNSNKLAYFQKLIKKYEKKEEKLFGNYYKKVLSRGIYNLHALICDKEQSARNIEKKLSSYYINETDEESRTPLHYACMRTEWFPHLIKDTMEIIHLLLKNHADPLLIGGDERLAWEYCQVNHLHQVRSFLVDLNYNKTVLEKFDNYVMEQLHIIISSPDEDLNNSKKLFSGPHINAKNGNNRTALHLTFMRTKKPSRFLISETIKMASLLLKNKSDTHITDIDGKKPWEHCKINQLHKFRDLFSTHCDKNTLNQFDAHCEKILRRKLNYDAINKLPKYNLRIGRYFILNIGTSFIFLARADMPTSKYEEKTDVFGNNRRKVVGWKFAISIAKQDVKKGWEITSRILIKYGVGRAKVLKKDTFLQDDEAGKNITIYTQFNFDSAWREKKWGEVINEIESELREAGVSPGSKRMGNKQVSGSHYISYRNDNLPSEHFRDEAFRKEIYMEHLKIQFNKTMRPEKKSTFYNKTIISMCEMKTQILQKRGDTDEKIEHLVSEFFKKISSKTEKSFKTFYLKNKGCIDKLIHNFLGSLPTNYLSSEFTTATAVVLNKKEPKTGRSTYNPFCFQNPFEKLEITETARQNNKTKPSCDFRLFEKQTKKPAGKDNNKPGKPPRKRRISI